jgi:hypothetical protein
MVRALPNAQEDSLTLTSVHTFAKNWLVGSSDAMEQDEEERNTIAHMMGM